MQRIKKFAHYDKIMLPKDVCLGLFFFPSRALNNNSRRKLEITKHIS